MSNLKIIIFRKKNYLTRLRTWKGWPTSKDLQIYCVVIHFQSHPLFSNELKQNEFTGSDSNFTPFLQMLEQKPIETRESLRKKMKRKMHKQICRPQVEFFPIIKVSPQFLIKGFSSNTYPDSKNLLNLRELWFHTLLWIHQKRALAQRLALQTTIVHAHCQGMRLHIPTYWAWDKPAHLYSN